MRISIVCGAGIVSGKEIMALELADGLRAKGYSLEIATSLWGNGEFARRLTNLGFSVRRLWLGFISVTLTLDCLRMTAHQMLRWPQLLASYRRFLRSVAPERVIHTNWHHLLLLWPFLRPGRDLFWLHEVVPTKPQYRRVFGFLARRLQCFVAVSQAVARSLADIGIAPNKIRLIYNGIKDPVPAGVFGVPLSRGQQAEVAPRPPEGGTLNEMKHHHLRVGIIGQIGAWKGHEDLLEAFAVVLKSHPAVELHVFGRGTETYESQLKHRAESLGLTDRIIWHGFVVNRTTIFRSIDICAVPSRFPEPLGLVAVEAGLFGLPVVASRRGGLPEIVEDGVTGFLVEPEKPDELAARLAILLKDEPLRQVMGERARERAAKRFGRERFVEEFSHLLEGN